jgi:predicted nucleic acid-binding protein
MRPSERSVTDALIAVIEWRPVDDALADRAGELAQRCGRSHSGIDAVDYVVAATAHSLKAQLWTRNVRHFPMFAGLAPPY